MTIGNPKAHTMRRAVQQWLDADPRRSQADLARKLGIDPSYLSRILGGERPCTIGIALSLHGATGIAVEKCLTGSDLQLVRSFLLSAQEKRPA